MASTLLRLMMLFALALMPLGMAGGPAVAHSAATATSDHCGGSQENPADAPAVPKAHCAACAALPAVDPPPAIAELRPSMVLQVEAEHWVTEAGPETDTPPPKLA